MFIDLVGKLNAEVAVAIASENRMTDAPLGMLLGIFPFVFVGMYEGTLPKFTLSGQA
jgi:hypothetical protein